VKSSAIRAGIPQRGLCQGSVIGSRLNGYIERSSAAATEAGDQNGNAAESYTVGPPSLGGCGPDRKSLFESARGSIASIKMRGLRWKGSTLQNTRAAALHLNGPWGSCDPNRQMRLLL
jgi:hypothetical protein